MMELDSLTRDRFFNQSISFLHRIGECPESLIAGINRFVFFVHDLVDPVEERLPKISSHQDDRNLLFDFMGLEQGDEFRKFVERPKSAGEDSRRRNPHQRHRPVEASP